MRRLPKGANAPLPSSGITRVELYWDQGKGAVDALCLAVDANGRVPADEWFVFYNQPRSPGGLIELTDNGPGRAAFRLRLDELPPGIQRCVCAVALEQGRFRDLVGLRLVAVPLSGEPLLFELNEAEDEQALILAEFYRHGAGWKLRAVGQGYRGGLKALAEQFGVAVVDDTPAAPQPAPRTQPPTQPEDLQLDLPPIQPPPRPGPTPPVPEQRPAGRRRRPWLVWVLGVLLLIGGTIGALGLFAPQWFRGAGRLLEDLRSSLHQQPPVAPAQPPAPSGPAQTQSTATRLEPPRALPAGRPSALPYQAPTCPWGDEEVFKRYHALGENYVRILQRVERSNKQLLKWRQELRQTSDSCPQPFIEANRQESEQLGQLPISEWLEESIKLNTCAGLMIKRIDKELNQETRPIISQRLVREADRARNLESDLTDIARDLAYLRNKTARLLEGLKENLDACGR